MNIERVRRLGQYDESPKCDFCDENMTTGFIFGGEISPGNLLYGTRGAGLNVCDVCLGRAKKVGIWNPEMNTKTKGR